MINFDDVIKGSIKEHNPDWPQVPDHSYRILIKAKKQINYLTQ